MTTIRWLLFMSHLQTVVVNGFTIALEQRLARPCRYRCASWKCKINPIRLQQTKKEEDEADMQQQQQKQKLDDTLNNHNHRTTTNRRTALRKITAAATASVTVSSSVLLPLPVFASSSSSSGSNSSSSSSSIARSSSNSDSRIVTPLEYVPALGGAYVVHYYLFGERFGAIVDTGSPFLTVPSTCNRFAYKYRWGCYKPELTKDSGYGNTVEGFDNNQGTVVWRKARFSFAPPSDNQNLETADSSQELVFGVFGPALLDGPGGVFLGLIKNTDSWIRPSFLGQTGYQSFCVDLRKQAKDRPQEIDDEYPDMGPKLILSKQPMIAPDDDNYIPLVQDLSRRYKDPVVHYTAKVSSFVVNGLPLQLEEDEVDDAESKKKKKKTRPTYVIFDTGVTGMVVSQELFDGRYLQARKNKEKSLWGAVQVTFTTANRKEVKLSAVKPVTTPLGKATPWRGRFNGNLIVLGLAFLDGLAMTIDVDKGKLKFTE